MTGRPKFELTINLGQVLTALSLLLAFSAGYTKLQVSIAQIQLGMQHFGSRMSALEIDVDDLDARGRDVEYRVHELEMRR